MPSSSTAEFAALALLRFPVVMTSALNASLAASGTRGGNNKTANFRTIHDSSGPTPWA